SPWGVEQLWCGPAPDPATSTPVGVGSQLSTVIPIERAVPATIFAAASASLAFGSVILVSAISRTWSWVSEPTLVGCGVPAHLVTPAAFLISSAAGGVLVMKVKERSS